MRLPVKIVALVVGILVALVVLFVLFEYVVPRVLPSNF
jgi:hypothetical protein